MSISEQLSAEFLVASQTAARSRQEYEIAKLALVIQESKLAIHFRTNPPNGLKITEAAIEELVKSSEKFAQSSTDIIEKRAQFERDLAVVESLKIKAELLKITS